MKTTDKKTKSMSDELRKEYRFDYSKASPNRFAAGLQQGGRLVLLEPEVAAAFPNANDVNKALKSVIKAKAAKRLPKSAARKS